MEEAFGVVGDECTSNACSMRATRPEGCDQSDERASALLRANPVDEAGPLPAPTSSTQGLHTARGPPPRPRSESTISNAFTGDRPSAGASFSTSTGRGQDPPDTTRAFAHQNDPARSSVHRTRHSRQSHQDRNLPITLAPATATTNHRFRKNPPGRTATRKWTIHNDLPDGQQS